MLCFGFISGVECVDGRLNDVWVINIILFGFVIKFLGWVSCVDLGKYLKKCYIGKMVGVRGFEFLIFCF